MKKVVLFIALFNAVFLFAQTPKFNAKNAAGIFYYNVDEALKKSKIKDDALKLTTAKELRSYNDRIKEISFLNSFKLVELETLVNSIGKDLNGLNGDQRLTLRTRIQELILPIRDSVVETEKKLNNKFEQLLSAKQNRKWLNYQKKQKNKLIPKQTRSQTYQNPQDMDRTRRNRRRY